MNPHTTQREVAGLPFLLRLSNLTPPRPESSSETALIRVFQRWTGGVTPIDAPTTPATFFTQVSILAAATRVVPANRLWVTFDDLFAVNAQGDKVPVAALGETISFGSTTPIDPSHAADEPAWWLSRSVHEIATFDMKVCSFSGTGAEITTVMRDAALAGQESVHVRLGRLGRSAVVDVVASDNPEADIASNTKRLISAFGWGIAQAAGGTDDILVTPTLDPIWEYRIWVVNGVAVAGAGIVEDLDPRANTGSAFDLQNRERRSDRGEVFVSAPNRVETLVEFARVLATANREGGDLPQNFAVDFAWDGEVPTIIDVNVIDGTALFAADPARIISALIA